MRISVCKDDPGYSPWAMGSKVFLDGIERSHVLTADEERRLIVRHVTDDHGRIKIERGEIASETLYGDVRIEFHPRCDPAQRQRLVHSPSAE